MLVCNGDNVSAGLSVGISAHEATQLELLEEISVVSSVIKSNTSAMVTEIAGLNNSSAKTSTTMNEIVEGMEQTRNEVKRQPVLVDDIQQIIDKTTAISNETSEMVTLSNSNVYTGMEQIKQLAQGAMETTNTLSAQTKDATNKISEMIQNLQSRAEAAGEAVSVMTEQNSKQNEAVFQTETAFRTIEKSISKVSVNTAQKADCMCKLLEANNKITASINDISATSQEVMTGTQATQKISSENHEIASFLTNSAKELMGSIEKLSVNAEHETGNKKIVLQS